jgi:hypothetical protein
MALIIWAMPRMPPRREDLVNSACSHGLHRTVISAQYCPPKLDGSVT